MLILVLGLRKGEVLGLTWELIDFDTSELYVGEQLQGVGGQLVRREVKTETSEAPLPLPGLSHAASGRRAGPGTARSGEQPHRPSKPAVRQTNPALPGWFRFPATRGSSPCQSGDA